MVRHLASINNNELSMDSNGTLSTPGIKSGAIEHPTNGTGNARNYIVSDGSGGWSWSPGVINDLNDGSTLGGVFFGESAGSAIETGAHHNVGIGPESLAVLKTGSDNVAIGHNAAQADTESTSYSIYIGSKSKSGVSNASNEIVIGYDATGHGNNTITLGNLNSIDGLYIPGLQAGKSHGDVLTYDSANDKITLQPPSGGGATSIDDLTDAIHDETNNLLLGSAGSGISTAENNVGLGTNSLKSLQTGFRNTGIGTNALDLLSSGYDNVAIGTNSLSRVSTTAGNTAVGSSALENVTREYNTAVGSYSLHNTNSGNNNTAVGYRALYANTSGASNVAIGQKAAETATGSSNSIYIGSESNSGELNASNEIVIGYYAIGNGENTITLGNADISALYLPGLQAGKSHGDVLTYDSANDKITLQPPSGGGATSIDDLTDAIHDETNNLLLGSAGSGISTAENNVGLGTNSLKSLQTGFRNTGIGTNALDLLSSGYDNVAIGTNSLSRVSTTAGNTAVGSSALENVTREYNTAVGSYSLHNTNSGNNNTAVGYRALYANTSGASNVAIGQKAAETATGSSNSIYIGSESNSGELNASNEIVIGYYAIGNGENTITLGNADISALYLPGLQAGKSHGDVLTYNSTSGKITLQPPGSSTTGGVFLGGPPRSSITSALHNVGIGTNSLTALQSGIDNVGVGYNALNSVIDGKYNTAVGTGALKVGTSDNNTAVGYRASYTNTSGGDNTAVGYSALYNNTTGSDNVAIGHNAAQAASSPSNSIYIGSASQSGGSNASNEIVIGYNATGNGTNTITLGNDSIKGLHIPGLQHPTFNGYVLTYNTDSGITLQSPSGGGGGATSIDDLTDGSKTGGVFLGDDAGSSMISGFFNVAVGNGAMLNSDSCHNNTAVGTDALARTGWAGNGQATYFNTVIGSQALRFVNYAVSNTVIGYRACWLSDLGNNNVAIGESALSSNRANDNIAIGRNSMTTVTNALSGGNIAIGNESLNALNNNVAQYSNIAIGHRASETAQNLLACICIGANAYNTDTGPNGSTIRNEIVIGKGASGNGSNTITLGNAEISALYMPGLVQTGSASDGYVLTYNSSSGITLQPPSGGGGGGGATSIDDLTDGSKTGGVFLGDDAGSSMISGFFNVAVGNGAMLNSDSCHNNTAVGTDALARTGWAGNGNATYFNTVIGSQALRRVNYAESNTVIGYQACYLSSGGNNNVAIGRSALSSNTANNNIAIGTNSMTTVTNALSGSNTAIGNNALNGLDNTGSQYFNIAIGHNANAYTNHNLTTCICIGANAFNRQNDYTDNEIVIGYGAEGLGGSNTITLGNESISALYMPGLVQPGTSDGDVLTYNISSGIGKITLQPSGLSDDRLKDNETDILDALSTIMKLKPQNYDFKTSEESDAKYLGLRSGFIAQEVLEIPELAHAVRNPGNYTRETKAPNGDIVYEEVTRYMSLDYNTIFTYAVKAIQEHQNIIQGLVTRIEQLESNSVS